MTAELLRPDAGGPEPEAGGSREDADRRVDLVGLSSGELSRQLAPYVDKAYRVRQIEEAIYQRGVTRIEDVTGLGLELRARLSRHFRVGVPETVLQESSKDGTVKYLFRLADGVTIETVDIPDRKRRTLCLSSQAGCALACAFCVTGYWGAGRNLTRGEILGQILAIRKGVKSPFAGLNLVFMGMGEPLSNLENVAGALERIGDAISWRRITISTAGVVPGIREIAAWPRRPNLAVSLHAPDDKRRDQLMPINRSHPLDELLQALREFPLESGRRVTIEYLLIRDFNDAPGDADALAGRLTGIAAKVNLIPINPDAVLGERMQPPDEAVTDAFQARLRAHGLIATVRRRRGDDVSAACGQLRDPRREPRGFRRSNLRF